jgi:hypothetical protein
MSTCRVSSTRRMSLSSTGTEAARAAQDIARQASPEQCHTFLAQVAACYNYSLKAELQARTYHLPRRQVQRVLDAFAAQQLFQLLHSPETLNPEPLKKP